MFSKAKTAPTGPKASETPRPLIKNAMPSIISIDLTITGDLSSTGDIQVEGTVEGDIESRTLTIGTAAQVRGAISGETIRVCGSVTGQIKGSSVTLAKTAKVNGDILHKSLSIEDGAFLDGHCRRMEENTPVADATITPVKDRNGGPAPESKSDSKPESKSGASGAGTSYPNQLSATRGDGVARAAGG